MKHTRTTIDCFGMLFEQFDIEPLDFANKVWIKCGEDGLSQ